MLWIALSFLVLQKITKEIEALCIQLLKLPLSLNLSVIFVLVYQWTTFCYNSCLGFYFESKVWILVIIIKYDPNKGYKIQIWQLSADHEKSEPTVSVWIFPVYLPTEVDLNHVHHGNKQNLLNLLQGTLVPFWFHEVPTNS